MNWLAVKRIQQVLPEMQEFRDVLLLHNNSLAHSATIV